MKRKSGRVWSTGLCLVLPALAVAAPAHGMVVWQSTFEGGDFTKEWNGSLNAKKGARANIDIVNDPVEEGKAAGRIVIHPDDTFQPYNQSRVELHHSSTLTAEGMDTYLSGYYRMPVDAQVRNEIGYWESNGSSQNVMDFWVEPKTGGMTGGGTTLAFGTGFLGATKVWSTDFTLNTWHQLAMHVHWSTSATVGTVSIWYDGVQVVKEIKAKTKADGNSLFYQTGFHRRSPQNFTETIYLDNFVEATTADEALNTAKPGPGGDGGTPADAAGDGGGPGDSGPVATDSSANTGSGGAGAGGSGPGSGSGGATGSGGAIVPPPTGSGGTSGSAGGSGSNSASGGCALGGRSTSGAGILIAAVGSLLARARRRPR